jgi:cell shape-determining protein MreC
MKRVQHPRIYGPFVGVVAVLILLFALPSGVAMRLRGMAVGLIGPPWKKIEQAIHGQGAPQELLHREIGLLKREKEQLKAHLELLKHITASKDFLDRELERLKGFHVDVPFFQRRAEELARLIDLEAQGLGARVVFREPGAWGSSLWIDVGERNNRLCGKTIVAKNSPVVVGSYLIGVIERVEERRSEVQLLTDANLVVAVRAVRGGEAERVLGREIDHLLTLIDTYPGKAKLKTAEESLKYALRACNEQASSLYLAKGELFGSSLPLWRIKGAHLHGVGFNYDFADREGSLAHLPQGESLIEEGDLLITTGFDGLFPPGLHVALVDAVYPSREGSSSREIEASPIAGDLSDLRYVTVLPSLTNSL